MDTKDRFKAYESLMKVLFTLYPDKTVSEIEKYVLGIKLKCIRNMPAEKILRIKSHFEKRLKG